ncbi:MAG: NAD-dependent epimerase/dehydratase family protein [Cyclobacteriaceae bacterium]
MKVLLVGGTSSFGKVLIPALKEVAQIITTGRSNCDICLDLGNLAQSISLPNGLDVIVHAAAHFGGKTPEEMIEAEIVNVVGTLRLCQASIKASVKHFIFISSIYSQMNPQSNYYSTYALSKKHGEEAALYCCDQLGLPLTVLRPTQLYGNTNDFGKHQPFLYAMVNKAEKGEDIALNGKNNALRNFLHAEDLAQIVLRVIQKTVIGVYTCQFPTDTSILAIAKAAISAFNSTGTVSFLEDKENIESNVFPIDVTLYKRINFFPQVSIEEGMRRIAKNRIQS